jgi:phage-related protein
VALSVAQFGSKYPNAKPWKGLGPGVLEIVRPIHFARYIRFDFGAIYVLHCFQKKSPSGIRTAKTDMALVEPRLKAAQADYEVRYGKASK